ncbi:MAG TPA: hypothetical protein VHA78_04790 [Candidatus Peribacteraceae bacterium]|nr:hypothetical protein [Candidatus Peribacteraceae bacterium]
MTSLHPQWQSTDDDERAVRITSVDHRQRESASASKTAVRASRKPAAIAGIALMLAIGFFWSGGLSNIQSLLGQAATSVTVTITPNGINPETISVAPGETITWTNGDTIPHILSSDTLPTSDGSPFMTSAIFPNASTHFLIPLNAQPGTYEYISKTAQNVSGHIIIQGTSAASASQPTVPQEQSSAAAIIPPLATASQPSDAFQNTSFSGVPASGATQFSSSSAAAAATGVLPDNPHTVGAQPSLPARPQAGSTTASITSHTPASEPATGPDVDIVIGLSVAALLWMSRKAFRAVA